MKTPPEHPHQAQRLAHVLEVLRSVEWVRMSAGGFSWFECPSCRKEKKTGHAPCCHIAAALEPR